MIAFSRNSKSMIANWWWTVDKTLLASIGLLLMIGAFLNFTASPAVANRINVGSYHFIKKQFIFLPVACSAILFLSMLSLKHIRRIAVLGYVFTLGLMVLTLFVGEATKGASRWIDLGFFSLQPSEFIKPTFIVVAAWLFDGQRKYQDFPGGILSFVLLGLTLVLLLLQPDVGMSVVVSLIWFFQLFLMGIPWWLVGALCLLGVVGACGAYFLLPHVQARLASFGGEMSYQVMKSLKAFEYGGIFGVGHGEGVVKMNIPHAHTDFIFAVAAEEYGMFFCLFIVGIYAFIVVRSMLLSCKENNLFIILATAGLVASFGLQGIINMASTMHLGPTKGMALRLISYGGSSLLAASIGLGMLLAVTRKNVYAEEQDES